MFACECVRLHVNWMASYRLLSPVAWCSVGNGMLNDCRLNDLLVCCPVSRARLADKPQKHITWPPSKPAPFCIYSTVAHNSSLYPRWRPSGSGYATPQSWPAGRWRGHGLTHTYMQTKHNNKKIRKRKSAALWRIVCIWADLLPCLHRLPWSMTGASRQERGKRRRRQGNCVDSIKFAEERPAASSLYEKGEGHWHFSFQSSNRTA